MCYSQHLVINARSRVFLGGREKGIGQEVVHGGGAGDGTNRGGRVIPAPSEGGTQQNKLSIVAV